ncbi:hypothetical protein [Catenulispora sp. GAS73]|uniref:hypothetical protein n=1 Tax=Catenulispora sp. GAS73 TaxID=3156269 RepID=UPI0035178A00
MEKGEGLGIHTVPLARLMPEVTGDDLRRVADAGVAIDQARTDDLLWKWEAGDRWSSFHMCVTEHHRGGDAYYLELEVESHSTKGARVIVATVNVVCWCREDHQFHDVAEVRHECEDGGAVADAFERTASQIIGWLKDTHDPVQLRTRVGLPSRAIP